MDQLKEITIELLASLLDDAAIDNRLDGEHRIYVTGLPFNFWLRIEHDRSNLVFSTYWNFREDVSEVEMLRCANRLNAELMMVQFFVDQDSKSLCGNYVMPLRDGVGRRQLLRAARMFAEIFYAGVGYERHKHLLGVSPTLDALTDSLTPQSTLLN